MSVQTTTTPGNDAETWPVPAPAWATHIDCRGALGLGERYGVFASGPAEPWSAVVERTDYFEPGEAIEENRLGIRLFTAPEDAEDEDILTPEDARAMAASLLRAADLLEQLQLEAIAGTEATA